MDRISPPDSTIFVDRRDKLLVPNGLYVIADTDGNATYKRFRPGPPKRFEPVSSNKDLEPLFPDNDPMIVGRVKRTQLDM
jgi:SOS-response transcriptional repressor LexA